jgi:hypothetical protein
MKAGALNNGHDQAFIYSGEDVPAVPFALAFPDACTVILLFSVVYAKFLI